MNNRAVFIDPSSEHFLNDKLFDASDARLNRDGTLLPFERLKKGLNMKGIALHTADKLRDGSERREFNEYWSLGLLTDFQDFINDSAIHLRGFLLMEPPLVQPEIYQALPVLSSVFDRVYLHNTVGDGYSLTGVNVESLRCFDWPQPYDKVLSKYWNNRDRLNKLVIIAGNHKPRSGCSEYYSKRIEAIAALGPKGCIDLYGRGWNRWWGQHARWTKYWRNISTILKIYHGTCDSKWEILSKYRFNLCFENMKMTGYVTEKIFDCFYAGTVPVYLGAPDICNLIPSNAFIDMRNYRSFEEMNDFIVSMSSEDWDKMREAGRDFLNGENGLRYSESLNRIFEIE